MELFKSFIGIMAYASLGFSAAAAYLKINKVWKRKHVAEVANSVSIAGNVVDLIPLTFFALNYMLIVQWQGMLDSLIWIVAGLASVLIGSGFWVQGQRNKSFWTRTKEALTLERSEVGHLASSFFRPSSADIVLDILTHFAFIDRNLADREREMIDSFAAAWHLHIEWDDKQELAQLDQPVSMVRTRDTVARYLKSSPPAEQVAQLIDILRALVNVDEVVSQQENLILDEVNGQLQDYVDESANPETFTIVIAPQTEEHDVALAALLPDAEKTPVAGGSGYIVGTFFSRDYANMIRDQYRALGFFTVDVAQEL